MIIIIMMMIITIFLYVNSNHVKSKFWICDEEELLIFDIKCWNTFRCNGS